MASKRKNKIEMYNNLLITMILEFVNENVETSNEEKQKLNKKIELTKIEIKNLKKQKKAKNKKLIFLDIITFGVFKYFRTKKINQKIKNLKKQIKIWNELKKPLLLFHNETQKLKEKVELINSINDDFKKQKKEEPIDTIFHDTELVYYNKDDNNFYSESNDRVSDSNENDDFVVLKAMEKINSLESVVTLNLSNSEQKINLNII